MARIFLLSPAHSGGERAKMLLNPRAQFDLAQRIRRNRATLGEAFAFQSGLYFRGKLTYASLFAKPPARMPGVWIITSNRGLLEAGTKVDPPMLRSFSQTEIDERDPRYRLPLTRSARRLCTRMGVSCEVVLLGSIATGKYVDVLLEIFGEKLLFPADFIGRGDMSRGGLLLRRAAVGEELAYLPLRGAVRRGRRAPKLLSA